MKNTMNFFRDNKIMKISKLMAVVCYLVVAFFICGLILSGMGRQRFMLFREGTTETNAYAEIIGEAMVVTKGNEGAEPATYAKNGLNQPNVSLSDQIYVIAQDEVSVITSIGLTVTYFTGVLPWALSYFFLARVFGNISRGQIFVEENSEALARCGIIGLLGAVICPFLKLLVIHIFNALSPDMISIATGNRMPGEILQSLVIIVAAYILHHGIQLKDEVEHTI